MYFMALATDYDGTIAHDGIVPDETFAALARFKASGRRLIMVTGRELPDLERVCPRLDLFDRIVAENGALLYRPETREARPLGPPPPPEFVARLEAEQVAPLSVGQVIVATWEPNETTVLAAIRDLGLDLQIIFNKGAVMVLPGGLNKASGLAAALEDLGLSAHNVIATGDAENDLAFMRSCGCAVAVANALPVVKAEADLVTEAVRGAGVAEVLDLAIADEARMLDASARHHALALGDDAAGEPFALRPSTGHVLIAGQSGSGKSTLANALLERMVDGDFQFCIIDPEGDYGDLSGAVVFGDAKTPLRPEAVLAAIDKPATNVVANLLGLDVADRPSAFGKLYGGLLAQHTETARPHWLLIDEAHHMLPQHRDVNAVAIVPGSPQMIFITVHPETLSSDVVKRLETVLAIGPTASQVVKDVAIALGRDAPEMPDREPERGETLVWTCVSEAPARLIKVAPARQLQTRHTRKYAEGSLGEDKSFYFRGPNGALNLRAQNLMIFLQTADGVDEATFLHHLKSRDYSSWLRASVKDDDLADEVEAIERREDIGPDEARADLRAAIEARYSAPAHE